MESGCRLSEILGLRWEDVDIDAGLLRLRSPKAGRPQVAPLSKHSIAMLKRLKHASAYVVAGRDPEKPRADLKGPWERAIDLAKNKAPSIVDVHVYDLRRTTGLVISRTSGLHMASRVLRHGSVKTTERHYAPLDLESIREAVEKRQGALTFKKKGQKGK